MSFSVTLASKNLCYSLYWREIASQHTRVFLGDDLPVIIHYKFNVV